MSLVERTKVFMLSVWSESKKVTWPSRDELKDSTSVVLVATFIVMIYLFVVDRVLIMILDPFLG